MLKSSNMTFSQFTQVPAAGAQRLGKLGSFQEGTLLAPGTATAPGLRGQLNIATAPCPQRFTFHFSLIHKTPQGTAFPPSLPRSIQAFSHLSCTVFQPCSFSHLQPIYINDGGAVLTDRSLFPQTHCKDALLKLWGLPG